MLDGDTKMLTIKIRAVCQGKSTSGTRICNHMQVSGVNFVA